MVKSGLNADSPPLGLNVVSHHNVEKGSKNCRQELIFFKVWFYARGGRRRGSFDFWNVVLICLFGVCNLGQAKLSGV